MKSESPKDEKHRMKLVPREQVASHLEELQKHKDSHVQAQNITQDAEREAAKIISSANSRATQTIERSKKKARDIEQNAKRRSNEMVEEKSSDAFAGEIADIILRFAEVKKRLSDHEDIYKKFAEQVVRETLSYLPDEEAWSHILDASISKIKSDFSVTLQCHPSDAEKIDEALRHSCIEKSHGNTILVQPDPNCPTGVCRVKSPKEISEVGKSITIQKLTERLYSNVK